MKTHLMFADRDAALTARPPHDASEIVSDLGLQQMLQTMSGGDSYLLSVAMTQLFAMETSAEVIRYRHDTLRDVLSNAGTVRQMYGSVTAALEELRNYSLVTPGQMNREQSIYRCLALLTALIEDLASLVRTAVDGGSEFRSPAFTAFRARLAATFDDEYLATVRSHLHDLEFERGTLISARLQVANQSAEYAVRVPAHHRFFERSRSHTVDFHVDPADLHAGQVLEQIRGRSLRPITAALTETIDTLHRFFQTVRYETAFYLGAMNLYTAMQSSQGIVCLPQPAADSQAFRCRGLYDIGLALRESTSVVANDVNTGTSGLVVVTGANQGGKTTFLRSVGAAQLMMQAGYPVAAVEMTAAPRSRLHTHFRREEDSDLVSGRFDEELSRMSRIIDDLPPGGMVLLNESFASTNEREGSAIGVGVVEALADSGHLVFYVTHMHELADTLHRRGNGVFLRAERATDGARTYRILPGAPAVTSYGEDLYREIFGGSLPDSSVLGPPASTVRTRLDYTASPGT